ncbi:MAG: sodium-translocating pyrophosphatase [Candidatus Helarchaeota archaeon]|nr:sodium-translocating pyrophosphatase [Candidatus Helarchaeota archaeon]
MAILNELLTPATLPFIIVVLVVAIVSIAIALFLTLKIKALSEGTPKMKEIAQYIREGAKAYLKRQYKTIIIIGLIIAVALAIGIDLLMSPSAGIFSIVSIAFLAGMGCSLLSGYIAMYTATNANVRTAQKVREEGMVGGLKVAFNGGLVMGLAVVGLSLLAVIIIMFAVAPFITDLLHLGRSIIGLAFGASLAALFAQLGGGIFTKAADVGADLVGKVEAGIPEDDPRNPGVIADNVGDNVGDIAGRGADLFESITGETIATMVLAIILFAVAPPGYKVFALLFPLVARAGGLIATLVGKFFVRGKNSDEPWNILVKSLYVTTIVAGGIFLLICLLMFELPAAWLFYGAAVIGLIAAVLIGIVTLYYTDERYRPVKSISDACDTGPATCAITGMSVGLESTALPIIIIAGALLASFYLGTAAAPSLAAAGYENIYGNPFTLINGGVFATALATMGMLSICGIVLSLDGFGPIADNAGGIVEMAQLEEKVRDETDRLDACGNTTKAYTKGYAIGSAALAAILLFEAYIGLADDAYFKKYAVHLSFGLEIPHVIIGLIIGALLVFVFTAYAMRAVGNAAGDMMKEIRRQFREIPGLKEGKEGVTPDYAKCVDISTKSSLKQMVLPGALVVITPILIGALLGAMGVGGFLMGCTVAGVLMALYLNTGGAAFDNSKKLRKKTRDKSRPETIAAYNAAVCGDTIGDPMKDTAGPSIHILIKLVGTISLQFAALFAIHYLITVVL